jgi:nucleotide-binding universal stress UspA family protein
VNTVFYEIKECPPPSFVRPPRSSEAPRASARGASLIVQTADGCDADIIVLGTHGKAGVEAFWAHSVTAKVLARTRRPRLLVPVK